MSLGRYHRAQCVLHPGRVGKMYLTPDDNERQQSQTQLTWTTMYLKPPIDIYHLRLKDFGPKKRTPKDPLN